MANSELAASNRELQSQAAELKAQTAELEEQRVRVVEADRLKSEFLSNMSHELRTPLNSILALSQLMISKGTGVDQETESEYLGVIERNGRHLLNLINDILDLSKIESGRMELEFSRFGSREIVDRVMDTIAPLAAEKGLKVRLDTEQATEIYSDSARVYQVVLNLASNAVKFTDQGEISLSIKTEPGELQYEVRDTGIGIDPDKLSGIFDRFNQVDGSSSRRYDGTGLGLAICRKLADLLGGGIKVQSRPGLGSTFVLSLPLGRIGDNAGDHDPARPEAPPAPRPQNRDAITSPVCKGPICGRPPQCW